MVSASGMSKAPSSSQGSSWAAPSSCARPLEAATACGAPSFSLDRGGGGRGISSLASSGPCSGESGAGEAGRSLLAGLKLPDNLITGPSPACSSWGCLEAREDVEMLIAFFLSPRSFSAVYSPAAERCVETFGGEPAGTLGTSAGFILPDFFGCFFFSFSTGVSASSASSSKLTRPTEGLVFSFFFSFFSFFESAGGCGAGSTSVPSPSSALSNFLRKFLCRKAIIFFNGNFSGTL
mmetsp:Transcript_16029/g.38002  ORF Transcript_16029/g.38002 Transcript_16029/m.38002 type:complete len:236 (-) Transcript_16029:55-762(-)